MLLIALPLSSPLESTAYAYAHVDASGGLAHGSGPLATLKDTADEVVALVPPSQLSWLRVQLPPASHGPRLPQVLQGLLEDRLLDDVDQLHLVLQAEPANLARTGGPAWVAVCNKAWLSAALAPLQAAGLTVQRIVPEICPSSTPALHALRNGDDTLPLGHVLSHPDGVTPLPSDTRHWPAFTPLRPEQASLFDQRWQAALNSPWNLAQGQWAQGRPQQLQRWASSAWQTFYTAPAWRAVRWGLGALLAVQVLGLNALAWREHQALNSQQTQLQNILRTTFPAVTLVVDAPLQMQREVNALRQKSGVLSPNDLEPLLATLATLLPADQLPQQIHFADHTLRVQGVALNPTPELESQGLRLRPDGADTWLLQAKETP